MWREFPSVRAPVKDYMETYVEGTKGGGGEELQQGGGKVSKSVVSAAWLDWPYRPAQGLLLWKIRHRRRRIFFAPARSSTRRRTRYEYGRCAATFTSDS